MERYALAQRRWFGKIAMPYGISASWSVEELDGCVIL
jgi:hypothetical protein